MAILPTSKDHPKGKFAGKPLSKIIWDEVVGDIKKPFKIDVKASSASAQEYAEDFLDQTDITQRYKATKQVFDLGQLVTNPAAFGKDLIKNTRNEIFNKDDLLSVTAVESVWGPMIKGSPSTLRGHDGRVLHKAISARYGGSMSFENPSLKVIKKHGTKKVSVKDSSAPGGWRVIDDPDEIEVFSKAGEATLEFIKSAKDKGGRNKAYREMQLAHMAAVDASIDDKGLASTAEGKTVKDSILLANSVGGLLKELENTTSAIATGKSQEMWFEGEGGSAQAKWDARRVKPNKKTGKTPEEQVSALKKLITDTQTQVTTTIGSMSGADRKLLDPAVKSYIKQLNKLEEIINSHDITKKAGLETYLAKIQKKTNDIANPNYFEGVGGRLIDAVHNMHVVQDRNGLMTRIDGGGMLQRWGNITKGRYERFGADDFIQTLSKGSPEVFEDYIWSKYKNRLIHFTPQTILQKALRATHNLGLTYEEDQMKKKGLTGAVARLFAKAVPDYKFKIKADGINFVTNGGNHFVGAVTLHKLLAGGLLNGVKITSGPNKGFIEAFTNPSSSHALISLLNDGVPDGFKIDGKDFKDIEKNLQEFREWLKANHTAIGIKFVGNKIDETSLGSANNVLKVINFIAKKKSNPDLIDPTQIKAGLLQHYTSIVARIQSKYFLWIQKSPLGRFLSKYSNYKEALAQAFSNWLYGAAVAATGGLGIIAAPLKKVINAFARLVVNTGDKLVRGFLKGDISGVFDDLINAVDQTAEVIVKTILYVFLALISIIFLFFGGILSSINPSDEARASGLEVFDVGGGSPFPGNIADCINDPNDGNFAGLSAASGVTESGRQIASGLLRGFWCGWNRHPDYPQYWNQSMFEQNPSPMTNFSCGNCLFWCTILPIEAYDNKIPGSLLNSQSMAIFFGYKDEGEVDNGITNELSDTVFIANRADGIGAWGIEPGDVVFFQTPRRAPERIAHVAMVHSVDADSVETMHSNAYFKRFTYTRNADGTVQSMYDLSGEEIFNIIGFGRFK